MGVGSLSEGLKHRDYLHHYMLMASSKMVTEKQPEFDETFNVTREAGSYNSFIEKLRKRLASANNPLRYAGTVPMLIQEQDGRDKWFDVILMSGNSQITVRIRYGDLYLVAFQGANGRWYEFRPHNDKPLFSNTVVLPYTSDYPTERDLFVQNTTVGRNSLDRAISSLAHPNFDHKNAKNRQLLINLMIMLPEALRFRAVSDFVYARIHDPNKPDSSISPMIAEIVCNWGALSFEMRRSELFGTFHELAKLGISNAPDAARLLGLVLWSSKTPPKPAVITSAVSEVVTSKGRQLVEIFWVQILDIDKKIPGNLYGKIQIVDGLSTPQYIFDRTKENSLGIKPQEYIPLTGPTRAISAFDSFYIDVSLMSSPENDMSRGKITWNYFADNVYNQPLREEVKGKYGSIAVCYAVYSNAVTATVQVALIKGVYKTIKASNTLSNETITLFNKSNKNYVDIKPQQQIPLLRSVVLVPLTSSIKVVADLSNQDSSSSNDPIAQGSVTFVAAASGINTGRINGKYGAVEVKVTWSSSWA